VPCPGRFAPAASPAAGSTRRRRDDWGPASARCRGANRVAARIGTVADGNCRRVGPDRGTVAAHPVAVPAGHGRHSAAAPVAVPADLGRRSGVALLVGPADLGRHSAAVPVAHHGRARGQGQAAPRCPQPGAVARVARSRRVGATAPVAGGRALTPASAWAARSRFPRGPSTPVPSAMRRRGRSLHISFALRRHVCRPPSSINHSWAAPSHPGTRVSRDRPANLGSPTWRTTAAKTGTTTGSTTTAERGARTLVSTGAAGSVQPCRIEFAEADVSRRTGRPSHCYLTFRPVIHGRRASRYWRTGRGKSAGTL
jgi:hypothetical protein